MSLWWYVLIGAITIYALLVYGALSRIADAVEIIAAINHTFVSHDEEEES